MMWKYLKKYKKLFFTSIFFLLLVDISQLIIPTVIGKTINQLKLSPTPTLFFRSGLIIVLLGIVIFVLRHFWRASLMKMAMRIETDLREKMYERLLSLSQHFYGKWETGDIMARATNDLNAVRMMFSFGVVAFFDMIVLGSAALIFMLHISPKLTLISIIPLPFLSLLVFYFEKKIHLTFKAVQEKFSSLTTFVQEIFSGIFVIKAFNREKGSEERFDNINMDYLNQNLKLAKLQAIFEPLMIFIVALGTLLVLYFGGIAVIEHRMKIGDLVAFFSYLGILSWPMMALGFAVNIYQRGTASLKRVEEIADMEPDIKNEKDAIKDADFSNAEIELKNVSFNYKNGVKILKNVNLKIKSGEKIAILGRIGAGKSTLIKLIMRFLDSDEGQILINGINIKKYDIETLRRFFSYVSQEPFLFSMSIRDNIAFFNPNISFDKIKEAAEIADMSAQIEDMPKKYDTMLGERGVNLSGGQKQRLTIARAVLKDAPVFIFDDAFSSVDTDTEDKILKNISNKLSQKTIIFIAHRISTIKDVDYIYVLDEGEIVESGTHSELIDRKGLYFDIYERQKLEEKLAKE